MGLSFNLSDYVLARVNLVRAGCPKELMETVENRADEMPIVIRRNVGRIGRLATTGYYPPAVIVAGAARRQKLFEAGHVASWAWIEKSAVPHLKIRADHAMSSAELMEGLTNLLMQRMFGLGPQGQPNQPMPGQAWPYIMEVYPFENYFVYRFGKSMYRQAYNIEPEARKLSLDGKPVEVRQRFMDAAALDVPAPLAGPMPISETGHRYAVAPSHAYREAANTGAKNSELVMMVMRDWTNIEEAVRMYLDAVRSGFYKPMRPAFRPVELSDAGKILAKHSIAPADFVSWSELAKRQADDGIKAVGTMELRRRKFLFVGDMRDPSTWRMPTPMMRAVSGVQFVIGYKSQSKTGGKGGSEVQSVLFDKGSWTEAKARKWLKDNGMKSGKLDVTEEKLRFRQTDPSGYDRFRIVEPGK